MIVDQGRVHLSQVCTNTSPLVANFFHHHISIRLINRSASPATTFSWQIVNPCQTIDRNPSNSFDRHISKCCRNRSAKLIATLSFSRRTNECPITSNDISWSIIHLSEMVPESSVLMNAADPLGSSLISPFRVVCDICSEYDCFHNKCGCSV